MIRGAITPAITILDKNKNIDFNQNKEHINFLIENGITGILSLGSIGEFFSFTMEEKKEFISFVVKTVNNRVPVLIGTGSTVMDEVIKLTQYAEKEGADGAAVITPYFFQFKEKALYNFFAKIASNTSLPIYLYNFPARSGVNISPELALKLGKNYTNIVGIKDSVGSIGHTRDLIIKTKGELNEFTVYSGFDEYFIPNLITGGDGVVGGLTNIIPGIFSDLYKAYQDQDFNKISNFCNQISNLMKLYDISQPFIPAIKQAVAIVRNKDINCTCKEPITDLTHTQINRIEKILKNAEIV